MSRIIFLDNARTGKNNWWRYLLTIILTFGTPIILGIIISLFIFFVLYLVPSEINPVQVDPSFIPLFGLLMEIIFFVPSLLFLYIGVRFIHGRKFLSLINTGSKVNWRRMFKGAGIWVIMIVLGTLISFIINPASIKVTFNPNTFIFLLIISLMVFPIQASFEELFFRGYLMQGIGLLSKKPVIPLLVTSVIFAVIHYGNGIDTIMSIDIVLQVFIFGLAMGIITLGEGGLETAMGIHISNNIFLSVVCNTPDIGSQGLPAVLTVVSAPNPVIDVPIFALQVLVLMVIIFWNKKDTLYNIFKDTMDVEMEKVEIKEI